MSTKRGGGGLLLYADGASRGNPGPAGAGAVLCTEDGTEVVKLHRYLGRATNNEAEYQGLILGLEAALRRKPERLVVYLDSELVVRQIQGAYKVKSPRLRPLHDRARTLLSRLPGSTIEHIGRALNASADRLANQAVDEGTGGEETSG